MDETTIKIIIVIFGVLQVVLFFKIWGMTDNIRDIKERLNKTGLIDDARVELLKGNKDKAKELLDTSLYQAIVEVTKHIATNTYAYNFTQMEIKYKTIYQKMNLEMPNIESYKDEKNLPI